MRTMSLYAVTQQFLLVHLRSTKGLSENSVKSYRDTLKLFFIFVAKTKKRHSSNLSLDDFDQKIVLRFLNHLESNAGNKIRTRNHRLALLRAFVSYLLMVDAERGEKYEKILQIPPKRGPDLQMGYLEVGEISAILKNIDRTTKNGARDYMLIMLMYNTGARVQEICDMKVKDIDLDHGLIATITGKGNKTRAVPLWQKTKTDLLNYFANADQLTAESKLFYNQQARPLTRHGVLNIIKRRTANAAVNCKSLQNKKVSPHTIRHTTAMHLLQSGVDLSVIRVWLGHEGLNTTHVYVEFDMKMKREALSKKKPPQLRRELKKVLDQKKDLVTWLTQMK